MGCAVLQLGVWGVSCYSWMVLVMLQLEVCVMLQLDGMYNATAGLCVMLQLGGMCHATAGWCVSCYRAGVLWEMGLWMRGAPMGAGGVGLGAQLGSQEDDDRVGGGVNVLGEPRRTGGGATEDWRRSHGGLEGSHGGLEGEPRRTGGGAQEDWRGSHGGLEGSHGGLEGSHGGLEGESRRTGGEPRKTGGGASEDWRGNHGGLEGSHGRDS